MYRLLRFIFLLGIMCCSLLTITAQSKGKAHDLRRDADRNYDRDAYEQAEEDYRKANIYHEDEKGSFNLGNAIFNQSRYEEAAREYERAAAAMGDKEQQSKAYYNLGNAHFLNNKYKESVEAFKRSLMANPDDLEAKQNLLMAMQQLAMQEQQQQEDQQENQDKSDEQNEQKQQNEQDDQQQQQQQQSSESQDDQQSEQEMEQKLSKEQAMQLLDIIDEEDKKVQEKLRKKEANQKKNAKDW